MDPPKNLCLPLMSIDEIRNQLWSSFATATFASVGESFFLVSPCHAFDGMDGKPIYIPIAPEPVTLANHGVVRFDDTDIAAIKLGVGTVDRLADKVLFVTSGLLDVLVRRHDVREFAGTGFSPRHNTVVSGYPSNRNTMRTRDHHVGGQGLNIDVTDISERVFADDALRRFVQIALDYDEKKTVDHNDDKVSPRNLQGMSGGPITRHFSGGNRAAFRLQGIFLRHARTEQALYGLRYEYVLAWLRANMTRFPQPPD